MNKELTNNQIWVIEELKKQGCNFLSAIIEVSWKEGKPYYIDSRVGVKGIRRKHEQGNREATE